MWSKTHPAFTNHLPPNNVLPGFSQLIEKKAPLDPFCNCGNEPEIWLVQLFQGLFHVEFALLRNLSSASLVFFSPVLWAQQAVGLQRARPCNGVPRALPACSHTSAAHGCGHSACRMARSCSGVLPAALGEGGWDSAAILKLGEQNALVGIGTALHWWLDCTSSGLGSAAPAVSLSLPSFISVVPRLSLNKNGVSSF